MGGGYVDLVGDTEFIESFGGFAHDLEAESLPMTMETSGVLMIRFVDPLFESRNAVMTF